SLDFLVLRPTPSLTPYPYTTLFRSDFIVVDPKSYGDVEQSVVLGMVPAEVGGFSFPLTFPIQTVNRGATGQVIEVGGTAKTWPRSEEHTSELQSREKLVCRLLLERK